MIISLFNRGQGGGETGGKAFLNTKRDLWKNGVRSDKVAGRRRGDFGKK